ncbi:hypothetical protein COT78_02760 [Candidatus Berkelbacteria bacterium CG10_big_fil_rev_8_21_14_0_10_43_13]|uniref:DUF1003 domain-containing protein n=1 Tax=Candidatus Berkelbacteria bacterium CG10_big_fil_rev_8_21_14_0_10_43_13 TaxID=1974514 RepID=A0A2H0W6G3_9BACT|nr:MAG: hypothetical protein COT78_02760 [Candidatus Berkelbacteria bacterium CG10_big_fil_rev_8_21_14_0_10_43_13]
MTKKKKIKKITLDTISDATVVWVGTTQSIIVHTILFALFFAAHWIFGLTYDLILLILTTVVSLEAIYLAIFIQRSVNQQADRLDDFEESLDDVEESLDDVEENLDDVEESIDAVEGHLASDHEKTEIDRHKKLDKTLDQIIDELKNLKAKIDDLD